MNISNVKIALYRIDAVQSTSINSSRREQSYKVGDDQHLYQAPPGKKAEEFMGMDLPFRVLLPKSQPGSISLAKGAVETTYRLYVSVTLARSQKPVFEYFPVRIKRYDKLSLFRKYSTPREGKVVSPDHIVDLDYLLNQTSFGPGDTITGHVRIKPNPDWPTRSRKVKIQKLSVQIIELITFTLEGEQPVEKKRKFEKHVLAQDIRLSEVAGKLHKIVIDFPSSEIRNRDGVVPQQDQSLPLDSCNGFTTTTQTYKIEYFVVIKANFSHCKDVSIDQPIVVTPFDHVMCMSLKKAIEDAVAEAKLLEPNILFSEPRLYRPHDMNSYMLYGVQRVGSLSSSAKPKVVIR